MKKLKKIFITILAAVVIVTPFAVKAEESESNDKVKVYIFEAGGCPYCEEEMEYLKSLDSYDKKFEIVTKELYIDHNDWKPGEDYELGVKVANEFLANGFKDASYQGTPFVVISDIYAAAIYSEDLETYINQAYEEGDRDAVSCIADGGTDCIRGEEPDGSEIITNVILVAVVIGVIALIIYTNKNSKDGDSDIDTEERGLTLAKDDASEKIKVSAEKEEDKVTAVKKEKVEPKKKSTSKKASTTKTSTTKKAKSSTKSTSKKK